MSETLRWFKFDHLPQPLHPVAGEVAGLAHSINALVPDGREKSAGMRKLLEAKDCFVRAAVEADESNPTQRV
jgi:hypothetical protein